MDNALTVLSISYRSRVSYVSILSKDPFSDEGNSLINLPLSIHFIVSQTSFRSSQPARSEGGLHANVCANDENDLARGNRKSDNIKTDAGWFVDREQPTCPPSRILLPKLFVVERGQVDGKFTRFLNVGRS